MYFRLGLLSLKDLNKCANSFKKMSTMPGDNSRERDVYIQSARTVETTSQLKIFK